MHHPHTWGKLELRELQEQCAMIAALLDSFTAGREAASQKQAMEDRSAHDPHAIEEPLCGLCHLCQPFTPAHYPFDFSLSLVNPNPLTAFKLICNKSKLTSASPNLHFHPAFGTTKAPFGNKPRPRRQFKETGRSQFLGLFANFRL